jgi:septal ring factor EnvC (AmiA/AmiB activator)
VLITPICNPAGVAFHAVRVQAARADMLARQLKRVEGARSSSAGSLSRLRRENDALKNLLLELAADRQAAQSRLAELQERMAELASTSSMMGEVRC